MFGLEVRISSLLRMVAYAYLFLSGIGGVIIGIQLENFIVVVAVLLSGLLFSCVLFAIAEILEVLQGIHKTQSAILDRMNEADEKTAD